MKCNIANGSTIGPCRATNSIASACTDVPFKINGISSGAVNAGAGVVPGCSLN